MLCVTPRRFSGLRIGAFCSLALRFLALDQADAAPSAEQLLARLDQVRQPEHSYRARVAITDYRHGKLDRELKFQICARKAGKGFEILAYCLSPIADQSKMFLARDEKLWFFDPRSARAVPISPDQARSYELILDALAESLTTAYLPAFEGEQVTTDLARRPLKALTIALSIRTGSRVSSPVLRFWLDDAQRPLKSEILAANGKPLRTLFYSDFKEVLGEQRPTRLIMLDPAESTVLDLRLSNFNYYEPHASLFEPDRLPAALAQLKRLVTE